MNRIVATITLAGSVIFNISCDQILNTFLATAHKAIRVSSLSLGNKSHAEIIKQSVDQFQGLVVVEFSDTSYCPPCRRFKPLFEQVAANVSSVGSCPVVYFEIDIAQTGRSDFKDICRALAISVNTIPNVYMFHKGTCVYNQSGYDIDFEQHVRHVAQKISS